jgi:hypothetical protein
MGNEVTGSENENIGPELDPVPIGDSLQRMLQPLQFVHVTIVVGMTDKLEGNDSGRKDHEDPRQQEYKLFNIHRGIKYLV